MHPDGSVTAVLTTDGTVRDSDRDYWAADAHFAYGITSHSAQGATVSGYGRAIVREQDDRPYATTALTRGAAGNFAFCVLDEKPKPGDRPTAAPEVARSRQLAAEHDGTSPGPALLTESGVGVLSRVLERKEVELSATETLERAFSDADSLRYLADVWADLSGGECTRRYGVALRQFAGRDLAVKISGDYRYPWLCRTLRTAEIVVMDGREVLAEALTRGSLESAENVCAVLDKRCREIIPTTVPLDGGWAARTPRMPDLWTDRLLQQVANAMDERTVRLAEHVAAAPGTLR